MSDILIKVNSDGKVYKAKTGNLDVSAGDEVLYEMEHYQEVAKVVTSVCPKEGVAEDSEAMVIRKINEKDREIIAERKKEAETFLPTCDEKIKKHKLAMDLLSADLSYDGKKLTFFFTAPGRVDFRSLVPELASTFKKLIRLQQVISRDKARCVDAIGRCGRGTCCRSFLKDELDDISQDMAYEQNLGQTGTGRVTGLCGRLQCCLKYEYTQYQDAKKKIPAVGSKVKTPEGMGKVRSQNIIKNKIVVELDKDQRIVEVDC